MAEDIADVLAGRPPRHRAAWGGARTPALALNVPASGPTLDAGEAKTDGTARSTARPDRTATIYERHAPRPRGRSRALAGLAGAAVLLVLVAGALVVMRRSPAPPASPSPAAEAAVEPTPSPSPSSGLAGLLSAFQGEKPAQLAIDLKHALRSGTLRVWVDGELVKEDKVGGRVTKEVLGIKFRRGTFHDVMELKPGRHEIQVQVSWDDGERTERVNATFNPGTTRRLEVNLGRLLKDLTLEWR
jgi:hypothetical protein